jgi:hypothetical protein
MGYYRRGVVDTWFLKVIAVLTSLGISVDGNAGSLLVHVSLIIRIKQMKRNIIHESEYYSH